MKKITNYFLLSIVFMGALASLSAQMGLRREDGGLDSPRSGPMSENDGLDSLRAPLTRENNFDDDETPQLAQNEQAKASLSTPVAQQIEDSRNAMFPNAPERASEILRKRVGEEKALLNAILEQELPAVVDNYLEIRKESKLGGKRLQEAAKLLVESLSKEKTQKQLVTSFLGNPDISVNLHGAAILGDVALIVHLIKLGADVSALHGPYGYTPLHRAVQMGHLDVVRMLTIVGVDIESRSGRDDMTPEQFACVYDHHEIVNFLKSRRFKDSETLCDQPKGLPFDDKVLSPRRGMYIGDVAAKSRLRRDRVVTFASEY